MKYKVTSFKEPHFGIDGFIELEPIPDEPKAERWAVVETDMIFNSIEDANLTCEDANENAHRRFTVVKLADNE